MTMLTYRSGTLILLSRDTLTDFHVYVYVCVCFTSVCVCVSPFPFLSFRYAYVYIYIYILNPVDRSSASAIYKIYGSNF